VVLFSEGDDLLTGCRLGSSFFRSSFFLWKEVYLSFTKGSNVGSDCVDGVSEALRNLLLGEPFYEVGAKGLVFPVARPEGFCEVLVGMHSGHFCIELRHAR